MSKENKYESWFLVHSGLKKPEPHAPTKGGFLLTVSSKLKEVSATVNTSKPAEKPKEEKGVTKYEKWFYRNCDNNNIPDLSELTSHDYYTWFKKHCVQKAAEPKYASPYEAWFFHNCDNRNIPDVTKVDAHDYYSWFKKHCVKKAPEPKYASPYEAWFFHNCDNRNIPDVAKITCHEYSHWFKNHATKTAVGPQDKSYQAWFERNRDSKNPGVMPKPVLTYPQWFKIHCTPSFPVKFAPEKHEPYVNWFERHSK